MDGSRNEIEMIKKKILNAEKKNAGPGGFLGFANAVIAMFGGADQFIGPGDADPGKMDAPQSAAPPGIEHDENPPARPDQ